ncbi:uncharacterized protein SPSK_07614 [Sporothrix schenckii 1099-18]|uniref:Metallo-beta-lactamase domain-containing protein n=2 Tax=Sporothrix schenckii TaxID=29908 RepID=U7Q0I9_SPOS1|nr:uncharacterized protein SPSK_07614 [Sporothrix schenckii 1099-18]ERT00707.1 hypothetical protein HMPREF1624_01939 [Sporothrix schenckii ATCC 58251]KJR87782.1 hypothetical protein SPSK_07614 [Sporothrix schenckii 1099-18]
MTSKALFDVPPGAAARVSIIDSTLRLKKMPVKYLLTPPVDGLEYLAPLTTWSFLVESSRGEKALFDLGVPPDLSRFSPAVVAKLKASGWDVTAEKNVADILAENGVDPSEIKSIIWSHWHWDHIGDPTTFPSSTELVVGPGFKAAFGAGYPTIADSPVQEKDWTGRTLREIVFDAETAHAAQSASTATQAGAFRAHDFFGDGSFFLLDTPGHAVGHLGALARTSTAPDTFVFMGGDLCHHAGELRPSPHLPLPSASRLTSLLPDAVRANARLSACPGSDLDACFASLNSRRGRRADEPFFDPAMGLDVAAAIETIRQAQAADAQDDVFFIFAHDMTVQGIVDEFPATLNDWKAKGWREAAQWKFLEELGLALAPKGGGGSRGSTSVV